MHNESQPVLPGTANEIALLPASDLLALLRSRALGAVELLDIYLDRLERINPAINAIVVRDINKARAAATEADKVLSAGGEGGALLGLPMTVKETYSAQGLPTTCGLPFLADNISSDDAVAVSRLRRAGAVIFGKTNVPLGGADHQCSNPIYGVTNNPWAADLTPGGSSGGAAAALSAGLTALELGSDIGGSIRIPAHFCGVFGHKATHGIVPTFGHVPPMPGTLGEPDLAVAGPLARTARDLELAMDLMVGPRADMPAGWSYRLPPSRSEQIAGFRVALWSQNLPYAATAETVAAIDALAADLRQAGATVSEEARPDFRPEDSLLTYLRTLFSIVLGGQKVEFGADDLARVPEDAHFFAKVLEECSGRSFAAWQGLSEERLGIQARWRTFFEQWDVMVCPVFPTTAFPHDRTGGDELIAQLLRRRQVDDRDIAYMEQLSWPSLATVANLPSTVIPVPRAPGELPLGLQIIGPAGEDRTTLRFAAELERSFAYGYAAPPLAHQ